MTDADVYAYEQEMDEMDEWEAMHAHEMEAAEEEIRAMEAFEKRQPTASQQQPAAPATQPPPSSDNAVGRAEDGLEKAQSRLDQVLARCATLLGEDGDDDVTMESGEPRLEHVAHKGKQTAAPTADTSTAEYLYSRPPVDVDSLSVVLDDGKRMFLRKRRPTSKHVTSSSVRSAASSLVPIKELMEAVERMEIEEAAAKEDEAMLQELGSVSQYASNAVLWLDKYRPQSFLDLLSDERTNREVLTWIKSWDRFVFPKKKRANGMAPVSPAKTSAFGGSSNSPWNQGPSKNQANGHAEAEDDEDKRPFNKIILICGPPGTGKTTLANIVARHAGYNPIEVNASDDRTASVLRNKIISAMEMQSIWGDRKPNCIILDEIDGAMNGSDGKSAIEVIQELANAPLQTKKAGAKTAAKNRHSLTRPLICICNDLYASVLRPLRQIAKIFTLDTPHPQRLVTRLKYICRHEGIKSSTGALAALCSSADNDVRYCLNTLQFQTTQSRGAAKSKTDVVTLSTGLVARKDHVHGMFEALDLVFYEARSKSAKGQTPVAEKIDEAVASLGNSPLLINGLDENVPKMIFNDPTMKKICDVFEWLGLADEYENRARSEQQYVFLAYIPFAAIATHASCCTSSRRRVEYPRAQFEAQKRRDRSENILVALTEGAQLQPILRMSSRVLVVDVVPWLIASLSPNIRRINPSLQTKEEKVMIQRLIQLMASLGLSFRHKYLPDGSEDYALEPALNELVEFRSSDGGAVYQSMLPLTVRKMISREVELEQMRRNENSASSMKQSSSSKVPTEATIEEKAAKAIYVLPELSEAEMAKKDEALRRRNPFAFAHREAKRKRDEELNVKFKQQRTSDTHSHSMVRYKFNEGYTCGIKTAVYVRDLL
ncbi:Chromosome transmission fidelity protein 18 [Phytophthora pseudosyringae]|uniref:Chromosome transmission fidelity protein 18 n=1 Tax=Phytophthora pseudosyringae TaxID=221518 RepID=A0A8T1WHL8_9STRA|nr:Chromosome transmission fidelity protein 18 [Phytophthora pseudosyringae]